MQVRVVDGRFSGIHFECPYFKAEAVNILQAEGVLQLQRFRNNQGLFGRKAATAAAQKMPAHARWAMDGASTPRLQSVAIKVLARVFISA